MEGHCSAGQSPQWAVVPMEGEEEEEEKVYCYNPLHVSSITVLIIRRSNCINIAYGIVLSVSNRSVCS